MAHLDFKSSNKPKKAKEIVDSVRVSLNNPPLALNIASQVRQSHHMTLGKQGSATGLNSSKAANSSSVRHRRYIGHDMVQ